MSAGSKNQNGDNPQIEAGRHEERRLLACLALAFCTNSLAESPARQAAAKEIVFPPASGEHPSWEGQRSQIR
jgi:hypothetical protein